ncbi:MAG: hypothetical protein GY765_31210 [bacterium]|nr:hypothetical protein [bacterium]
MTITLKPGSEYDTRNGSSNFVLYGAVQNTGATGAVFPEVEVALYCVRNNWLGSFSTYIKGGSNVDITTSTTNALLQNETGYFKITTTVSASVAHHWTLSYDWNEYSHTTCQAPLVLVGTPAKTNSGGNMRISGVVRNPGTTHTASFAEVYMAMFNSSNQLIGLESTYVDGDTWEYLPDSTTNTALYPGQSKPFSDTTSTTYADVSTVEYSIEWNEDAYSSSHYYMHGSTNGGNFYTGDFDGDGDTDIAIWRPSNGRWCIQGQASQAWGVSTDIPVPGDYDGDGDTDIAILRPSNGRWCIKGQASQVYGVATDIPVPGDYDGDGDTDIAIWRPSNGRWCVKGQPSQAWGVSTDIPVPADYDGDGTTDIAVYRPSTGRWAIKGGGPSQLWGVISDHPVPADYDGDGDADIAIWRPSIGRWAIKGGGASQLWGVFTDIPVPGDFDGDGDADIAIFRKGLWAIKGQASQRWGTSTDMPLVPHRK